MAFETILYKEEGAIGWLTLNRPDDGNMFTAQMCHEIRDCINDIRRETRTRVLVITGAGDMASAKRPSMVFSGVVWSKGMTMGVTPQFRARESATCQVSQTAKIGEWRGRIQEVYRAIQPRHSELGTCNLAAKPLPPGQTPTGGPGVYLAYP